jgi:hypothetical protein
MWFNRSSKSGSNPEPTQAPSRDDNINQGVFYLYTIIGVQVLLLFGLLAAIMVIGKVLATPLWVFLFAFFLAVAGCVYLYRKAKRQLQKLRDVIQKVDLSDRNYEISVMGGFLTMRVEQNPRRLLEAPPEPLLDSDTIETPVSR